MAGIPFAAGDVVYFKTAKKSSARKSPIGTFEGHGFGVFLGHVANFQKDPTVDLVSRIMGASGYLSFDDIIEFLGQEKSVEVIRQFEDKYYGKVIRQFEDKYHYGKMTETPVSTSEVTPENSKEVYESNLLAVPKPPQLIGLDGKPIGSGNA